MATATAADASARLSLFGLLTGSVRLVQLHIDRPDLSVERYGPGMFNVYETSSEPEALEALSLPRLRVTGPFDDPEIDQPNFLVAVAGPLLDLVRRGFESMTKDDCRPFYSGLIAHP